MENKIENLSKEESLKKLPILKMQQLAFFKINVLNLILYNSWHCYYCEKYEGPRYIIGSKDCCEMCTIPIDFSNFEEHLDKNEFNENFLRSYHARLVHYLMENFCLNESSLECFLFEEFCYSGCDWNTGQRWSVPLKEQIEYRQMLEKKNPNTYFKFFY